MLSNLEKKHVRFLELSELISNPDIISDMQKFNIFFIDFFIRIHIFNQ